MIYYENHFFFRRTTELCEDRVIVKGSGFLNPSYEASFHYRDLSSEPHKIKAGNNYITRPIIFITVVSTALFLLSAKMFDFVGEFTFGSFVILTPIMCLLTLFFLLRKTWHWTYLNKYGHACFTLCKRSNTQSQVDAFNSLLQEKINSSQKIKI